VKTLFNESEVIERFLSLPILRFRNKEGLKNQNFNCLYIKVCIYVLLFITYILLFLQYMSRIVNYILFIILLKYIIIIIICIIFYIII